MSNIDIDSMSEDELRDLVRERGLRPTAADVYGGSTAGGGMPGGGGHASGGDDGADFMDAFEAQWNNPNGRDPNSILTPQNHRRYVSERLGRHTLRAMKDGAGKKHIWENVQLPDFRRY